MKALLIHKNTCYAIYSDMDVFYLRDHFRTPEMVKALLKALRKVSIAECNTKQIIKYENGEWSVWLPEFKMWENVMGYKPQPHLESTIQYQKMRMMS